MRLARGQVLGVVGGLLVVGALVDRTRPEAGPPPKAAEEASAMPTAAPAEALSSTFYCAGATTTAAGTSTASVVVANTRNEETRGNVTIVTTAGPPKTVPLVVGPSSVAEVSLGPLDPAVAAAAVVDLQSGQAAAELVVSGGQSDPDVTPCASSGSGRWYFPDGSTARDASLFLSLFNPFPEDAIADLTFSSEQGRAAPGDLQGVVVPARSLVVLDIGEQVRRRESIATTVVVRTGRLVAAQSLGRTAPGRTGVSVTLGAPSLAPLWYFPDGLATNTVVERYSLYNPGLREAEVALEVNLDEGVAEPFELLIPAGDRVTVTFNDEARVPKGIGHSTTVRSGNGVPVVATRTVEAAAPARSGRADTLGARRGSRRWLFPAGGTSQVVDEVISVQNAGTQPSSVSLLGLVDGQAAPLPEFQGVTIEPGRRQTFRVGDALRRAPLAIMVNATSEVVAERGIYATGRQGLSVVVGIPLE
jgi:Family of unknown function (DUF5719)